MQLAALNNPKSAQSSPIKVDQAQNISPIGISAFRAMNRLSD
jgi:hypothetical protein